MTTTLPQAEAIAEAALRGCGDATLGEWRERGKKAFHVRRRLTDDERALAGGLTVVDQRNTDAGRKRLAFLFHDAPVLRQIAQQIGETA